MGPSFSRSCRAACWKARSLGDWGFRFIEGMVGQERGGWVGMGRTAGESASASDRLRISCALRSVTEAE